MVARCPVCGKPLLDGRCMYCELKSSLSPNTNSTLSRSTESRRAPVRSLSTDLSASYNPPECVVTGPRMDFDLGELHVVNPGNDVPASLTVTIDGETDTKRSIDLKHGITDTRLVSSSKKLRSDYSQEAEVSVTLQDADDTILFKDSSLVRIRPVFDMDLEDMTDEIATRITSNAKEIKDLLSRDGAVEKAVEDLGTSISGYQDGYGSVMDQIEAVWNGLQSLGLKYVSDTESLGNALTYNYQRVKLPRKVLEERTGNCIELSCLFASIFEAMGLYPVIAFPPGHAIVGVVLSGPELPEKAEPIVSLGKNVFKFHLNNIGNGQDGDLKAVFIESTMISSDCGAETAIATAYSELLTNKLSMNNDDSFAVVQYDRHFKGMRPISERYIPFES